MRISFSIDRPLCGFAVTSCGPGEQAWVCQRELLGPTAIQLTDRLEKLQAALFSRIPGLPSPSQIDHIVVFIGRDLSATAVVNELQPKAEVRVNRPMIAGEAVYIRDIEDIASLDLGIQVPSDAAVVVMRSFGWRRSLFFDFVPLSPERPCREYALEKILAQQALLLLGLPVEGTSAGGSLTRAERMASAVSELEGLLSARCEEEGRYQEFLENHPWILGRPYSRIIRHQALDDSAIPDFTALRCYDNCHDIIELKQPFVNLFKESGQFGAGFNDAWNQAEGYLQFTIRNSSYLEREKNLRFENPHCVLICGHALTSTHLAKIREKEALSRAITVVTYDQLLEIARHVLALVRTAGDLEFSGPS